MKHLIKQILRTYGIKYTLEIVNDGLMEVMTINKENYKRLEKSSLFTKFCYMANESKQRILDSLTISE